MGQGLDLGVVGSQTGKSTGIRRTLNYAEIVHTTL